MRGLDADLGTGRIRPLGHVVHGADEPARHVAEASLEAAQRVVRGGHDAVEVLGVGLEPGEQRIGVVADDEGGLMQRRALVLDAGDEAADAFLVAAEGALDGRDFLVDDFFQHGGALHGMLDAADQQVDLGADGLGDGGEALGGDVLRAHQAHGGLEQGFRDLAQIGRAPQEIGRGPDDADGNQQQGNGLQRSGQHGARGRGAERVGMGEEPAAGPQGGQDDGHRAIGREGRAAAQAGQHHGGAGIVLIGGAAPDGSGIDGQPGRVAPLGLGISRAAVRTARLGGICHVIFPALSLTFQQLAFARPPNPARWYPLPAFLCPGTDRPPPGTGPHISP